MAIDISSYSNYIKSLSAGSTSVSTLKSASGITSDLASDDNTSLKSDTSSIFELSLMQMMNKTKPSYDTIISHSKDSNVFTNSIKSADETVNSNQLINNLESILDSYQNMNSQTSTNSLREAIHSALNDYKKTAATNLLNNQRNQSLFSSLPNFSINV